MNFGTWTCRAEQRPTQYYHRKFLDFDFTAGEFEQVWARIGQQPDPRSDMGALKGRSLRSGGLCFGNAKIWCVMI